MLRPVHILPFAFLAFLSGAVIVVKAHRATPQVAAASPVNEREAWAFDLAVRLGNAQPSQEIVSLLVAWQQSEGGDAAYNPLNTTQEMPGATCYNADPCVKNYPDYESGMHATLLTLASDYPGYADIVGGIQHNDPAYTLDAIRRSPWGTHAPLVEEITQQASPPAPVTAARKAMVTPTMEISAAFDATDCSVWGFQAGCQHWGTDYAGERGTPVYAPFDLTIIAIGEYGPGPTMGQYVQGTFADGYVFYAGHLEGRPELSGTVPAGTLIGYTNIYDHTHIQLGRPGDTGACAQSGVCVDFDRYWRER